MHYPREKQRLYMREWRKNNPGRSYKPEKARAYRLKNKYGISLVDYNTLFAAQNGLCLVCKRHQSQLKQSLVIDHSHENEKVRGLLCVTCNVGLGFFMDNIQYMENAIEYLKRGK